MLPKKLIIFIYLLFKAAQPLMASEVFYTNTIDPDSYLNFGRTIRKVDLNDNTFFKLIDNAVLCDVSNDESLILYSPSNSLDEYSYPGDPQSFIIKNLYQYDTLNIHGHNARFTSNGDIISFTTHSFDYYDLYNNDNNAGLSSIQTYSRSGDSVTVLSDSIFYGFYILSDDKNRILWLEKVSAEDSLEIFIHTIDNGQTNTLNAKISTTAFFDANESNLFFWARNDLLYASLMDSNSVYCLFSIDISQNPDSFTKIFSSDTDIVILPTQDFEYDKFLFSQKITDGIWYEKIWVHNINDESSEFVFDFFSGQSLYHYIWSADTSKIYFTSSPTSWGYGGSSGPFYEYDFPSDLSTILSNTYNFSYSSSLIHFDNNVNTGPSKTELINPLQNENIELNQYNINDSTTFSWSLSQDIDNDSLSYTFCLWDRDEYYDWIYGTQLTNPFKIFEQNLTDTIITLSNSFLYDIFMEAYNEDTPYFRWSVDVNDGFHILDMNYGNAYRITFNYVHTEHQKWHVSTGGSDSTGDGSVNNPFATIQQGIDNASHGDTVLVSPGLYCGSVDFIGKNIVVGSHFLIDSNDVHIDSTILGPGDPYDYSSDCGYYFGGVNFVSGEDSTAQFIGFTISGTWGSPSIKCIGSNPSISYLNIENNTVTSQGVLEIIDSHPSLDYLNLLNNKKSSSGHMVGNNGAAMSINNSTVSLSNSLIVNNISVYEDNFYGTTDTLGGGIIVVNNSILMQNNNTFFGNSGSTDYASAIHIYDSSSSTIKNSIFWNDSVHEQIIGSANITYSNVYGGWDGEGNINMDPLFCNPDSNDFTLAENSPAVEIGENGLTIGALGIGCEAIILAIHNKVIPKHFSLYQNYPNPFNPVTVLRYDLPEDGLVNITIYDMMGRIVKTLVNSSQTAGYKSIRWNATNDRNEPVSAGLYLYTIQTGEFRQTKKMVLLK